MGGTTWGCAGTADSGRSWARPGGGGVGGRRARVAAGPFAGRPRVCSLSLPHPSGVGQTTPRRVRSQGAPEAEFKPSPPRAARSEVESNLVGEGGRRRLLSHPQRDAGGRLPWTRHHEVRGRRPPAPTHPRGRTGPGRPAPSPFPPGPSRLQDTLRLKKKKKSLSPLTWVPQLRDSPVTARLRSLPPPQDFRLASDPLPGGENTHTHPRNVCIQKGRGWGCGGGGVWPSRKRRAPQCHLQDKTSSVRVRGVWRDGGGG